MPKIISERRELVKIRYAILIVAVQFFETLYKDCAPVIVFVLVKRLKLTTDRHDASRSPLCESYTPPQTLYPLLYCEEEGSTT